MIKTLSNITHFAADLLLKVAALGLLVMTLIVGWQVFGRFVLHSSPSWSEQAALTLMIWFVFLAAASGVREGFHIRILAVENIVTRPQRRWMRICSNIVVLLCGLAMLRFGGELVLRTWQHTIPSLGLPRGVAYLGIPISGLLIALFSLERTLEEYLDQSIEDEEDPRWS